MMEEGGAAEREREQEKSREQDIERSKDSKRCGVGCMYVAIGKVRSLL